MHILSNEYVVPKYINEIRNRDIRLLFTRLRTDLNILASSRANKKRTELCPLCNNEPETVSHFITRCPVFVTERNNFYDNVSHVSPFLPNKCDNQQLEYILDLRCPPEIINQCCKFVANLYARRERYSIKKKYHATIRKYSVSLNVIKCINDWIIWSFFGFFLCVCFCVSCSIVFG